MNKKYNTEEERMQARRANSKRCREKHREERIEYSRRHYQENKHISKEYYEKNKESLKEYKQDNLLKFFARNCNQSKRLKKYNIVDKISEKEMEDLYYIKQNKKCAVMNIEMLPKELSPDHIIPLCKGGSNKIDNIQLVWWRYNQFKQSSIDEESRKEWSKINLNLFTEFDFSCKSKINKFGKNIYFQEIVRSHNKCKRLEKYNIINKVLYKDIEELYYDKQNKICPVINVKIPFELLSLDHIIPIAKGGNHTISNIQLVWWRYNYFKNDSLEEEARQDWAKINKPILENLEKDKN